MKKKHLQPGSTFKYVSDLYWIPYGSDCPKGARTASMESCLDNTEVILVSEPHQHEPKVESQEESVVNLSYYKKNAIEAIDVIENWDLGPHLANVIKYIARHGSKPGQSGKSDLLKARAYLTRKINQLDGKASWDF